jgi:hypothetical protein
MYKLNLNGIRIKYLGTLVLHGHVVGVAYKVTFLTQNSGRKYGRLELVRVLENEGKVVFAHFNRQTNVGDPGTYMGRSNDDAAICALTLLVRTNSSIKVVAAGCSNQDSNSNHQKVIDNKGTIIFQHCVV